MQRLIDWLVQSSADPERLALTVKGFLLSLIPIALMALRVFDVQLSREDLEQAVILISAIIASITTIVGLVRKIYLTLIKPSL